MLDMHLSEFRDGWNHYLNRLGRFLDDPPPGKKEHLLYGCVRKSIRFIANCVGYCYARNCEKYGEFFAILKIIASVAAVIFTGCVIFCKVSNLPPAKGIDLSSFNQIYAWAEFHVNFYLIPTMTYLITVLILAHMIGIFFSRAADYEGYSLRWFYGGYIKSLGEATVGAILFAFIAYAFVATSTGYKSSLTLGDYITWAIFAFTMVESYIFMVKSLFDVRNFFVYPSAGVIFSVACTVLSFSIFEFMFNGDLLKSIARIGNDGYTDVFMGRVQKILGMNPEEIERARSSVQNDHLLGENSLELYHDILKHIEYFIIIGTVIVCVFCYISICRKKEGKIAGCIENG